MNLWQHEPRRFVLDIGESMPVLRKKITLNVPVINFEKLVAPIKETKQCKYELPLREFVANQEYSGLLDTSKKALERLDFDKAIVKLKQYQNRGYVMEMA